MKSRFGFILVKTQIGENIGASARALKNFGFSRLNIVSPNIIEASFKALIDSLDYKLYKEKAPANLNAK